MSTMVDIDGTFASYFGLDRNDGHGMRWGWYALIADHRDDAVCEGCYEGTDCWAGPFPTSADALAAARRERREK